MLGRTNNDILIPLSIFRKLTDACMSARHFAHLFVLFSVTSKEISHFSLYFCSLISHFLNRFCVVLFVLHLKMICVCVCYGSDFRTINFVRVCVCVTISFFCWNSVDIQRVDSFMRTKSKPYFVEIVLNSGDQFKMVIVVLCCHIENVEMNKILH